MKKILSLILTFCLISMTVACGTENQTDETSANHDKTEMTSTSGADFEQQTTVFNATVLQTYHSGLLVQTDDPHMLLCSDKFEIKLPENVSNENFMIGDIVEITFRGGILEVYPARIPEVLSVSLVSHEANSTSVTFFAKVLSGGSRSLYVKGNAGPFGIYAGFAHLSQDIAREEYQTGDYVAITFPSYVMETYPPQINVTDIRYLTEAEIAEFPISEEKEICLQYMGRDETKIIGICGGDAYAISLTDFENIPEMTFGDYFTVIYEESIPSSLPSQLLFIKDIYFCDENGICIE